MNYRIVTETSEYALAIKVRELLEQSWRPQGGVSFVYHSAYKETWAQAMVKE